MNSGLKKVIGLVGALALASSLAACGTTTTSDGGSKGDAAKADPNAKVTLTVVGLLPGATPEAQAGLADQVKDFEEQNPNITIKTQEYEWKATTFSADLAGGTLPDVYEIPFTDAKTLIANGQIADMNDYLTDFANKGQFNESVLQYGKGADGDVYAIPAKSIYGTGLHYNRDLFTQAGLDPDKPPTTWDEVEADAKQIADKTGMAGFAQMAAAGTGGWQLTVDVFARGGNVESVDASGKATATLQTPEVKDALNYLKTLRWTDNSMGSNFSYDWAGINQDFAAGKIGMFTSGQDVYTSLVQADNIDPKIYGLTMIPTENGGGVLGGGTLAAVSTKADENQKAAAVKWINYYYLSKYTSQEAADTQFKLALANNQPVGTPELPMFTDEIQANYLKWMEPYVNVPLDQMKGFTDNIGSATIMNEPQVATQDVYAALDPAVQAVLTDENADIDALLATAQTAAQRAIDKAQR
jgi:ABC-type glycerol-3-phosphate transport system substrate-binding protein